MFKIMEVIEGKIMEVIEGEIEVLDGEVREFDMEVIQGLAVAKWRENSVASFSLMSLSDMSRDLRLWRSLLPRQNVAFTFILYFVCFACVPSCVHFSRACVWHPFWLNVCICCSPSYFLPSVYAHLFCVNFGSCGYVWCTAVHLHNWFVLNAIRERRRWACCIC